jgi:SET domain-containing protein
VTQTATQNSSATPSGLVAIRDIAAEEELTYNYGYEMNDEPAEPCHCGAKHCCGYILGPQYWDHLTETAGE